MLADVFEMLKILLFKHNMNNSFYLWLNIKNESANFIYSKLYFLIQFLDSFLWKTIGTRNTSLKYQSLGVFLLSKIVIEFIRM